MGWNHEPRPPHSDFSHWELRALLDRGIDPLKRWVREDLVQAPRWMGFHVTTHWENHLLACYLSHFLPKLPPGYDSWQQDVLVVHCPEYQENGPFNRIYTQMSGNCVMPDDFHAFFLALTRAFGHQFIPVPDLRFWLEHGVSPEHALQEPAMLQDERLLHSGVLKY